MTPLLTLGDAAAFLIPGVGRGGRAHYMAASACLSAYAGREIVVAQRSSGRPRLDRGGPELGVSLSWRDGFLLVGYSPTTHVGVDIEPDDPTLDPHQLARDHFARPEADLIAAEKTPAAQRDLFLRLWVAKEAILKTTGRGVYDGLDEPDLSAFAANLRLDGSSIMRAASARAPAGGLTVASHETAGAPALYLALARLGP